VRNRVRGALQSFRINCSTLRVAPESRPLGINASSRVLTRPGIALCVRRSRFAVSRFLGCAVFPGWGMPIAFQQPVKYLSASYAFLQSVTQLNLADRPQSINSSHELSVPSAHVRIEGPPFRGLCMLATFRLQGLGTLLTVSSLRSLAGSVSNRQRSWDSPLRSLTSRQVSGTFPPGTTHLPFLPPLFPTPKRRTGPAGPGSWAFSLPRAPVHHRWV
jgi:hypothetical protein